MSRIKEWWLRKPKKWKLVIIAVPVLDILGVVGVDGSLAYFKANPAACGTCHLIEPYVKSYYESDFLDNAHWRVTEGPVKCKDCHITTLDQIALEGINFITGNYEIPLVQRKYQQEFCLSCHGSYEEIKELTKGLATKGVIFDVNENRYREVEFNRHDSHYGEIDCWVCHKAHRAQEDYCALVGCHAGIELELGPGWKVPE